jgi:hypothetical protein
MPRETETEVNEDHGGGPVKMTCAELPEEEESDEGNEQDDEQGGYLLLKGCTLDERQRVGAKVRLKGHFTTSNVSLCRSYKVHKAMSKDSKADTVVALHSSRLLWLPGAMVARLASIADGTKRLQVRVLRWSIFFYIHFPLSRRKVCVQLARRTPDSLPLSRRHLHHLHTPFRLVPNLRPLCPVIAHLVPLPAHAPAIRMREEIVVVLPLDRQERVRERFARRVPMM